MTSAIESGQQLPAATPPMGSATEPGDGAQPGWPAYVPAPAPPPGRLARLLRTLYTKPAWLAPLALLACFGMSVAYVERFNPTTGDAGPTGGCAFKALTGMDCPGCGGTRAFYYLLHGNLPEAARNHLLAVFAAPFLVYVYVAWTVNRVVGKPTLPMLRVSPTAIGVFMGVWLAFAVLRNLPWAPFTFLFV